MASDLSLLPKGFPARRRGSCVPAAYYIARSHPQADVVCGYIGPRGDEHTWVEMGGTIIDPTIRQFRWYRRGAQIARREVGRMSSQEFVAHFEVVMDVGEPDRRAHYKRIMECVKGGE